MNSIHKLIGLLLLTGFFVSCERKYEAPPLDEPIYDGTSNISIAGLKERYTGVTSPTLINTKLILNAVVISSDKSGNIYKQLYIRDETGGINIAVDQNSIYAAYRVGQEIFLDLNGLYITTYGDELQISYAQGDRVPWDIFVARAHRNKWPDNASAVPITVELGKLTDNMVNTLVTVKEINFVNGGLNNFTTGQNTTNEQVKDKEGNFLDVRTSAMCDFAADKLPLGTGDITGILGRYRGSWQLFLRDVNDLGIFDGIDPTEPGDPDDDVIFYETFGGGTYPSGNRPKISEFTDFDMKTPVAYSDGSGNADIRSVGANGAHVWFPANRDTYLKITGINATGKRNLMLSYQLSANLFDAGTSMNLNAMTVTINGKRMAVPSIIVSNENNDNNKFYDVEMYIEENDNLTIEFFASGTSNTLGLRLDNIKITAKATGGPIILDPSGPVNPDPGPGDPEPGPGDPEPGPGDPEPGLPETKVVLNETFGTGAYPSGNRPRLGDFTDFDMKGSIVYTDASGNADIRSISGDNGAHVWFPANRDTYLTITGIDATGYTTLLLSYQAAANLSDAGTSTNLNVLKVKCNDNNISVPSMPVSNAAGDNNTFYTITIDNISATGNITLEFSAVGAENNTGLRLDNIKLTAKK